MNDKTTNWITWNWSQNQIKRRKLLSPLSRWLWMRIISSTGYKHCIWILHESKPPMRDRVKTLNSVSNMLCYNRNNCFVCNGIYFWILKAFWSKYKIYIFNFPKNLIVEWSAFSSIEIWFVLHAFLQTLGIAKASTCS